MCCLSVVCLFLFLSPVWAGAQTIDKMRVHKAESRLELISGNQVIREIPIALGGHPAGHKHEEGDSRTPEGLYTLDWRNSESNYHKSIHISYPDEEDRLDASTRGVNPGSMIMIHGQRNGFGWASWLVQKTDWTDGCIALTNSDMDEIWGMVTNGTPIEILP
ncbi:MAG: L,D-transpeptidase family protein [Salaquimonas sp.]|nr:L,D-transpeptidase family protein [Salaquimonas sp.]